MNVERKILPRPDRTRAALLDVAARLREMVGAATGSHVAIRIATMDPATFIALK